MKKQLLILLLAFIGLSANAQDTILFSDFETTSFYSHFDTTSLIPPGISIDTMWYSCDLDGHSFAGVSVSRNGFYKSIPFSTIDHYPNIYGDSNHILMAFSWTNLGDNNPEDNWLITKSVTLGTHDTLFWKSAPFSTPRFLDGYEILLSNQTNDLSYFTHSLFRAGEMVGSPAAVPDTVFADFTFAPTTTGVFLHGLDGTYINPTITSLPNTHTGRLRPFSIPLDSFAGQTIFIAFHHNSSDDDFLSLDDIMIRGDIGVTTSVSESEIINSISISPNPFNSQTAISFAIIQKNTTIKIMDIIGKEIKTINFTGRQLIIDKGDMQSGIYFLQAIDEQKKIVNKKIIIQ